VLQVPRVVVECEELLTKEDLDFELSGIAVEGSIARQYLALKDVIV
jgi:hypothetical protein